MKSFHIEIEKGLQLRQVAANTAAASAAKRKIKQIKSRTHSTSCITHVSVCMRVSVCVWGCFLCDLVHDPCRM